MGLDVDELELVCMRFLVSSTTGGEIRSQKKRIVLPVVVVQFIKPL